MYSVIVLVGFVCLCVFVCAVCICVFVCFYGCHLYLTDHSHLTLSVNRKLACFKKLQQVKYSWSF